MEDLEYIGVPYAILYWIALDLSTLDPSSAGDHWMYLRQVLQATLDSSLDVANLYFHHGCSQPVSSHRSSPTLHASSRATSMTLEGLDENRNLDNDDLDILVNLLDLDGDLI